MFVQATLAEVLWLRESFKKLTQGDESISCSSAGMSFCDGDAVSENAVTVCKEIGVDISGHRSKAIRRDDVNEYDVFAVMAENHAMALVSAGVPKQRFILWESVTHLGEC